jgi:hypothetical protein
MYSPNYDSCNRFKNESDCNNDLSLGIGGYKCNYDSINKICKANYSQK